MKPPRGPHPSRTAAALERMLGGRDEMLDAAGVPVFTSSLERLIAWGRKNSL